MNKVAAGKIRKCISAAAAAAKGESGNFVHRLHFPVIFFLPCSTGVLHSPVELHTGQIGAAGECQGPGMDQFLLQKLFKFSTGWTCSPNICG